MSMKMNLSRRSFRILLFLFLSLLIIILAIISLISFGRWFLDRDSKELKYPSSNVNYHRWQLPDHAKLRLGKGIINDIKISPNSNRFAIATTIGIWIYDAETGKEISLFKGDRQNILKIAFSSNGDTLTGVNHNAVVWQWDAATGEPLLTVPGLEKGKHFFTLDFSANGMVFASLRIIRSSDRVFLYSIADIRMPATVKTKDFELKSSMIPRTVLSSDGRYFAAATSDENDMNTIRIWKVDSGELLHTLSGDEERIECLAFSPDSSTLVSGDWNERIMLWDLDTNGSREIYKGSFSSALTLAFSPNGKLLTSGNNEGRIRIWDLNGKEPRSNGLLSQFRQRLTPIEHRDKVSALAFSPDSKMLISGSEDGTVRGWDVTSRRKLFISPGHSVEITGVAATEDKKNLMSLHAYDRQVLRWDINKGHHLAGTYFSGKSPEAISPDAKTLIIEDWFAFRRNTFKVWDFTKRSKKAILWGHNYQLSSSPDFVFSANGKMLASKDFQDQDGDIYLWNIENQQQSFLMKITFRLKKINYLHKLTDHTDRVRAMVFSPNGYLFASSGYDRKLCLWDVKTGKRLFARSPLSVPDNAIAFSPNGKILACGTFSKIILWDTTTGQEINRNNTTDQVNSLQFSPDGRLLVSGTHESGNIELFDAQSLQLMSTHQGHTDDVESLLFSSDGKTLVSASEDGTMLLWDWEKITR